MNNDHHYNYQIYEYHHYHHPLLIFFIIICLAKCMSVTTITPIIINIITSITYLAKIMTQRN